MPYFNYTAVDKNGSEVKGAIEAQTREDVARRIQEIGYRPTEIKETKPPKKSAIRIPFLQKKLSAEKLIIFTRQFISLLHAGVPLLQSLQILSLQAEDPHLKKSLTEITLDVEGGKTLSESMQKYPAIFPVIYVTTVHAGEVSSTLPELLKEVVSYMEFDLETKRKLKAAVRYPIMVVCALTTAFVILMVWVVPKFIHLFEQFGSKLPLPTRILLWTNHVFQEYWLTLLIVIISLAIGLKLTLLSEKGRYFFDYFILKLPISGKIIKKIIISRFARLLYTLYKSGIPILNAFTIIENTISNKLLLQDLLLMEESVTRGTGIASALKNSRIFPPMVQSMLSVGEESKSLDVMLEEISNHYDREVGYLVENLESMIEPILLAFLGAGILFLALAIFLPMWSVYRIVGH
ncbi:type II secretion system F family protein [Chlamydiota bacterium]